MRRQNIFLRLAISLWAALSLLTVSLMPAFAAASADEAAKALQVVAHDSAETAGAAVRHADHHNVHQAADVTGHKNTSCAQHDHCSGKCCAACAQCFTATSAAPTIFITTHSPRLSSVPRLHDRLVVAGHNRPPAV